MFNPANLAKEVFGILRSFDYVVNIFDTDGNRVYEPEEARRFFASPKNITVSIHEDGENSSIKMFLSKSIDITEVSGLIETMRSTASKFGLLFNVRKYERELKPKDLAPNGASDFDAGVSLASAEGDGEAKQPATDETSEIEFKDHKHEVEGDKLDRVTGEVGTLTKNFKEIVGLLRNKKVKESMTIETNALNEAEGQTINLGILGVDVETDAWENFKKGYLSFDALPDLDITDEDAERYAASYSTAHDGMSFNHDTAVKALELDRVINAIKGKTPLLAAALRKAHDLFVTGSAPKVVDAVVNKAIAARSHGEDSAGNFSNAPAPEKPVPAKHDMVSIKEFRGKVERQAWQDFVDDHIDFSAAVDFSSVKLGASANKMAVFLNLVASKTTNPGLANMFTAFASDIEDGRGTPFKTKVAKHAVEIAQHGKVAVGESLIMTESIKEFGKWFDSMSSASMFEAFDEFPYDDRDDNAVNLAWKTSKENFSPEAFLDTIGSQDFGYGDDSLADDEKTVDYEYVKSSLVSYLSSELGDNLQNEYPDNNDAATLADQFMPDVVDAMASSGWTVAVKPDVPETGHDLPVDETVGDDMGDESVELSTEDVLLPSRADNDLTREVTADHDTDDMDRIISLARGNAATFSPRTPQP
jgi:hypothetical protein